MLKKSVTNIILLGLPCQYQLSISNLVLTMWKCDKNKISIPFF